MIGNIRIPYINGGSTEQQLYQVKNYLYQLVEQLNFALNSIETTSTTAGTTVAASSPAQKENEAISTFNSIKSLIIKSADIVNAYYEVITKRLEGLYVSKSDFGVYMEETSNDIIANSESINQNYTNIQQIITDIKTLQYSTIEVNANIKTGLLYYEQETGIPVYGLEIGQRTEIDGVEVFNKYARFTSDRLSFYDQNDNEVAYISDNKLFIKHVEVTGSFTLSGFVDTVLADKSVVTKWMEVVDDGKR